MSQSQYQLYIVSNSGCLVFCKQSVPTDSNMQIDIASMLFAQSQMANSISPFKQKCVSGFTKIHTKLATWTCFTSLTGLKFFLETSNQIQIDALQCLQQIYVFYCDFVLKNPFSIQDQPIKANKFEKAVQQILESIK